VTPCNIEAFKKTVPAGDGYYTHPSYNGGKGWCKVVAKEGAKIIIADKKGKKWKDWKGTTTYVPA